MSQRTCCRNVWATVGLVVLSALGVFVAGPRAMADTPALLWSQTYSGQGLAVGNGVAADSSGVYVTGNTWLSGSQTDCFLIRYNDTGTLPWTPSFNAIWGGSLPDGGYRVAISGDVVYVAGFTLSYAYDPVGDLESDAMTLRYSKDGVLDTSNSSAGWWTRFSGASGYYGGDAAFALATDDAGNLFVGGHTVVSHGTVWSFAQRYDSAGVVQWHQEYGEPGLGTQCRPGRIALAGGNLYSVAGLEPLSKDWQVIVRKFDGQIGTPVWMTVWGTSGVTEKANDVAVSGDDIFVTGSVNGDVLLLKLRDDGDYATVLSSVTFAGAGNDTGNGIIISGDRVYVVGSTEVGGQTDALLLAYDLNLNLLWSLSWGGAANDSANHLAACGGTLYVTGNLGDLAFVHAYRPEPVIIYVSTTGADTNSGLSWQTAKRTVAAGLAAAVCGDEVWVAAGTYTPAGPGGARNATFQLKNCVAMYGGFDGTESGREARNFSVNVTILSGDLNGDDGPNFANNTENSYHVVTASGTDATAILDGFTIAGGNAGSLPYNPGGGLYNVGGSPTLANCTISRNVAYHGGGLYTKNGSPTLTNCTFSENSIGDGEGSGMRNESGNPTLENCTFMNNNGLFGAGLFNQSGDPTLTNCTFSGNSGDRGSGLYHGTGIATLTNCLLHHNSATGDWGGAIHNSGTVRLTNCTLSENSALLSGGGLHNFRHAYNGIATLTNCILWGNTAASGAQIGVTYGTVTVTSSCIQGGWPGTGNISDDPLFADPGSGDYRLLTGSPCIDAGQNLAVPPEIVTDLCGNPRFIDDPATPDCRWAPGTCGTPPIVDMGAYELLPPLPCDFDHDGDVDQHDLVALLACVSGPTVPLSAVECNGCDLDYDGDVDQNDFGVFQRYYSGARSPATVNGSR